MPRPPKSFHGFIGQTHISTSVERLMAGCQASSRPLPHSMIAGLSGSGKTHLAEAVSRAMGTKLHYILCGRETKREVLAETMSTLSFGDILLLDEIHALPNVSTELLYPAIDTRRTLATELRNRRVELKQEWIDIEPFTVLAATDRPGELRNAFRRRMQQTYHMSDYTQPELREIAAVRAAHSEVLLTPQARTILASVCRGSPRNIKHAVEGIRIYHPQCASEVLRKKHVLEYLRGEGIDHCGLTQKDLAYLDVLRDRDNRPTSLQSLALAMGCDTDFIALELEPFLVKQGLVSLEKTGRLLTPRGLGYHSEGF